MSSWFLPSTESEPSLHTQFPGYLYYSLQTGPEILNRLHENVDIVFSPEARVIAHQNTSLPHSTESGPDWDLDWVIADDDIIVGYESAVDGSLDQTQLQNALEKVELNAEGRDVLLFAITPETSRPEVMTQFANEPVQWLSWSSIARQLFQIDETEVDSEQLALLRMMQDLFEAHGFGP